MPDASIRAAQTADLPAITAVMSVCQPYLIVTPESLAHSGGDAPPERFVSEVDGEVAGFAGIGPSHWGDGDSHAMQLVVLPAHRGKGIGTALMRRVEERFAASGGTRLVCGATGEDGLAFARERGFTVDRVNVVSRLDLTVPLAEPEVPEGIRLARIAELTDLRPLYDTAMSAMRDIPGSLSRTTFTYERWERQNRTDPRDDRSLGTVARSGGEVAAFVQVQRSGERIHTNFTGTHPGHRGRGLATLVKRSALRAAADAGATAAYTVNDAENAPMLAVNTRLGHLPDIRRYSL
ncbi:MAG TPA: GNAT family N-acetyltransferase, partial [Phytomonospora sp.]